MFRNSSLSIPDFHLKVTGLHLVNDACFVCRVKTGYEYDPGAAASEDLG